MAVNWVVTNALMFSKKSAFCILVCGWVADIL